MSTTKVINHLSVDNLNLNEVLSQQDKFFVNDDLILIFPQFRNIIPCEVLFYIEVTFWALSIDLGIFRSSWFLHRHKIPHPNQWGSMITTKKYSLFYEDFSVVGFICI